MANHPGFIPDSSFKPDAAQPAPAAAPAPGPAPASAGPAGFIPDSQFQSDEEKFGSPLEQLKAGAEGIARGASLGLSDVAETKLGVSTPEAVRARREENPFTSFMGEAVGAVAPILATEGAAAPAALGVVSRGALTGGVLGAGSAISDMALGDPNLSAQKVLAHIGMGVALGAGGGLLEKGIAAVPALWRSIVAKEAPAAATAAGETVAAGVAKPIASLDEAAARLESAKKYGAANVEKPQAAELRDALSRVDLGEWAPPEAQINAIANADAVSEWNLAREMSGKAGDTVRGIESMQKQAATAGLDSTIESLSPAIKPTSDAIEAGERASAAFAAVDKAERQRLGPIFQEMKKAQTGPAIDHLAPVVDSVTRAVPEAARMFDTEAGKFAIKPWNPQWGLDEPAYNAIKKVVESIKSENPEGVEALIGLRRSILPPGAIPESKQLRPLQATMMDYIQGTLDRAGVSVQARNAFKDWRKLEENKSIIERTFGATIGSDAFSKALGKSEAAISGNIFRNDATVEAAKAILPKEKFNELLANYLAHQREKATDLGVFKSGQFARALKSKDSALSVALADNPQHLQRLHDLTTVMRILPDAPSMNTSGTAKTALAMIKQSMHAESAYAVLPKLLAGAKELMEGKLAEIRLNDELAGRASKIAQLKSLQGMAKKAEEKIAGGARAVWGSPLPKALIIEGGDRLSESAYDEHVKQIRKLSENPDLMSHHLESSTVALSGAAPNITQGVQSTIARGVQFLATKIPGENSPLLLAEKYKPSNADKLKFGKYYNAVNNPTRVLAEVKRNKLNPETMEALQAVHPDLLDDMRMQVMSHFSKEKAKSLSYSQKAALSQFLGQPLDENMTAKATAQNQIVFASPSLSEQAAPKPTRATIGGMKKLNVSGRAATQQQEQREK